MSWVQFPLASIATCLRAWYYSHKLLLQSWSKPKMVILLYQIKFNRESVIYLSKSNKIKCALRKILLMIKTKILLFSAVF